MENQKNALLITYYWPPSGGAGVHRWLRFSKFFMENNCALTVYCPENAAWPVIDTKLEEEIPENVTVLRTGIFEPHKYLEKGKSTGVGFTQTKKSSVLKKIIVWVRGNLFIPDSRVFWIKPSVHYLSKYLKEHPEIKTIISTGPPHSMHLIARALKRKLDIKWIADFRDPWTQIDFYQELLPGKRADEKQKKLEKSVLSEADEVVTVSRSCAEGLKAIVARKVHVITNGYIFPEFDAQSVELDSKFNICYYGSMPFGRNPEVLWKALDQLITKNEEIKKHLQIALIGSVDFKVLESAKAIGLSSYISVKEPVPHHESIHLQRKAQLLLLVGNNTGNVKGILTGKFFEYLGAKRPVIAIGQKESDLELAMSETQAGYFASFDDVDGLSNYIEQAFILFQNKMLYHEVKNLDPFRSQKLAQKFIELI